MGKANPKVVLSSFSSSSFISAFSAIATMRKNTTYILLIIQVLSAIWIKIMICSGVKPSFFPSLTNLRKYPILVCTSWYICNKLVHSPQIPVLSIVSLYWRSWKIQFGSLPKDFFLHQTAYTL
jgi:hypothetical protein